MNDISDPPANALRLCHIFKWESFDGYGFNLHAEKGKPGQYIGKVDQGSPAEAAGLKEGDRIVEVNGVNISNENHKQVVQRIKAIDGETKLFVVDPEGDAYFKSKNVVLKSSLPYVVHLVTPPARNEAENEAVDGNNHSHKIEEYKDSKEDFTENKEELTDIFSKGDAGHQLDKLQLSQEESLNLNMTAKELRAQLAAKKKFDPKKQSLDLKKKYDIVQKL